MPKMAHPGANAPECLSNTLGQRFLEIRTVSAPQTAAEDTIQNESLEQSFSYLC